MIYFRKCMLSGILLTVCLWAFASGQTGNIRFKESPLEMKQAFKAIESQTDYTIAYNEGVLNVSRKIDVPLDALTLEEALKIILDEGKVASYTIVGNQIILSAAEQERVVENYSGVVSDQNGAPVPGCTVYLSGTRTGVTTSASGKFAIDACPGDKLEFACLGYRGKTVTAGSKLSLNVMLVTDSSLLDESIVIGYGTVQRKDLTTAVSVVSTSDIEQRPIVSAVQALQGRAAGVTVVQPSGMPGSALSVRVRGTTSVQASNEPLYVVDGVPSDDISHISADDIESMQVLKDASSSAIYGARAANGVVIITTKRGHSGKTSVRFNAYAGVSRLSNGIEALNTEQYKELMKELGRTTTTVPVIPDDETRYTDWEDVLFGTGINQNYQLSMTNGTDRLRYYVSVGHTREKGIVSKAHFNRTNFRANIDSDIYKWLEMSLNVSYSNNQGRTVRESRSAMRAGSILLAVNTPPFMEVWDRDNKGQYDEDAYGSRILNPMAANAADMTSRTDRTAGSVSLNFKPFDGFSYKVTYSMDLNSSRSDYYLDPVSTSDGRAVNGEVNESKSRNFEWLLENIVSYERTFGQKHKLSLMAGATQQRALWEGNALAGYDMSASYPEIHSIAAANQLNEDGTWSSASAWSLASFLGRVSYNYDYRYLLTANFRADGSSKFAPGHRWGMFPSVSVGWRLSEEPFMENTKHLLDDLKIRAGWGINGNQGGIGNYSYLASMSASKVLPTEENPYPGLAISPNSAANPDLTWEKTTQYNVGVDLAMFNSRLVVNVDAYYKHTKDLLLTVTLPANVNLPGGVTRNDGEMVNKGMELAISSKNFVGEFKWNTDFNISFNRNRLTKLGLSKVYYFAETYTTGQSSVILKEGLPVGTFFGYKSQGVDPETGDLIYEDVSGNGSVGLEDRTVIGCAQPKFTYGLTNDFSWKGLTLSIFLQGSYGNQIFNASRIDTEGMFDFRNQSVAVLRRWKRPGMKTDIPRSGNIENIHNSTRFVEDGSYLRVKNLTLAYDLPRSLFKRTPNVALQIYATAQNLLTFTKYSGYDPEVNAYGGSAVALGVDYGTYPQARTMILGVKFQF